MTTTEYARQKAGDAVNMENIEAIHRMAIEVNNRARLGLSVSGPISQGYGYMGALVENLISIVEMDRPLKIVRPDTASVIDLPKIKTPSGPTIKDFTALAKCLENVGEVLGEFLKSSDSPKKTQAEAEKQQQALKETAHADA